MNYKIKKLSFKVAWEKKASDVVTADWLNLNTWNVPVNHDMPRVAFSRLLFEQKASVPAVLHFCIFRSAPLTLRPSPLFLRLVSSDRPTCLEFPKNKSHDVVKAFLPWNNSFDLKNEHGNSIEKYRNKNRNIFFYSILCISLIQISKFLLLTSSWATRASYSDTSCDFFESFFFQSDRPTNLMS